MKYTRNSDPNFYETHLTNCGSFALSIEEWYSPDETLSEKFDGLDDYFIDVEDMCGGDVMDMSEVFATDLAEVILDDFTDLEYLPYIEVEEVEGLIAFRAFFDGSDWWDFHFKVFRDGRWQEKNGRDPVHDCELEDWTYGPLDYVSRTFYFLPKQAS